MAHIPNEDLDRIERKLESIEQKIGSKWILPIVVALISGLIGLATVVIQVSLERSSSEARMELERSLQKKAADLSGHQIFYNDAITLVERINGLFRQACAERNFTKGDLLNQSTIECFTLISKHRPHYGEEKAFIKKMQEFDDLVQGSVTDFEAGRNKDQDRQKARDMAKQKYDEVLSSLDEFYKQYLNKPESSAH